MWFLGHQECATSASSGFNIFYSITDSHLTDSCGRTFYVSCVHDMNIFIFFGTVCFFRISRQMQAFCMIKLPCTVGQ